MPQDVKKPWTRYSVGATACDLLKASALAGLPQLEAGKLRYHSMPPVGQAVTRIAFADTNWLFSLLVSTPPAAAGPFAHACGLRLFPDLSQDDRAWLRRIGRGNAPA